ncbi:acyl-CoA dehydrogenase family protein [Achromobacter sp. SIMBA_011]|uniref:acyl-CoA dehydrogenase family protein n=1 Tax=Achromobacter TaxID=222 RepID=UPI0001F43B14|nr:MULTISPECIES: acyl-CoA dehydrogenase family protein [Achromobacter]EFV86215.1 acyl-CoA dehydrogenase-like protein [Achromobacter xylosoxidans C54]MCZ8409163.1 acyl-CoA dehydrogenase family protein [Achromobacter dolens]
MNFELTEDDRMFVDAVRRFAQDKLAPSALARAHSPDFPSDVAAMLADQGLLGIAFSEADGGMGGTLMQSVLAIQEVALACPKSADVVQAGNFGPIRTFVQYATDEQKKRFLPDLLRGRSVIALGMSEPDAGSAVTELKMSAKFDGDEVILDGSKVFSTHSPDADLFLVYVRFGPGVNGIGSVLVERGTPGFEVGNPSEFMSGEQWSQLYFQDCRIPIKNVLLGEGGFKKQISGFNVERLGNASRALALGRYCFNTARDHALDRKQFGRRLCDFQGIQWKFAEMALKLESAQLLLYKAAMEGATGLPTAQSTAIAKLACNTAAWDVANEALQVMGAMGYSKEALVEYCVRRIRGWMIAGGSLEILKNRIAEGVFGQSFPQRHTTAA